tara:strand:+ start:4974 stop:6167 length:1194 start_codon:yes stop_codon:yes gene_type:complete
MKNTDIADQTVESPEVEEKGALSGFQEFSIEEDTDSEVPTEVDVPDALENSKEEETTNENTEETVEETAEEAVEEEKEENKEQAEKEKEPEFEFKAPELTEEEESEAPSETWKHIGEDLDLAVEGEEFEDFKKAFASKLEKAQQDAYNQGLQEAETEIGNLDDLDPQTRNLIELSQNGIDLKEYLDPINTIDGYLKYDDKSLVQEELRNIMNGEERLYTDEQISSKIERLEDNEMLSDKADEIREELIAEKQNISQEIIENQEAYQQEQNELNQQNLRAQSENFINTVNSTNEFMGGKINNDIKQHVNEMWQNGEVHNLFNDPKKIVDYVLYHTVGDQVLQQRDNESFSNGQSKAKKSLHNVPPVISGGASRGANEKAEEAGDFSVWESAVSQVRAE